MACREPGVRDEINGEHAWWLADFVFVNMRELGVDKKRGHRRPGQGGGSEHRARDNAAEQTAPGGAHGGLEEDKKSKLEKEDNHKKATKIKLSMASKTKQRTNIKRRQCRWMMQIQRKAVDLCHLSDYCNFLVRKDETMTAFSSSRTRHHWD